MHPDGEGAHVDNEELNIAFNPPPKYAEIAKAASCGKAWAGEVATVEELKALLPKAVKAVKGGLTAVLDAHIGAPSKFA